MKYPRICEERKITDAWARTAPLGSNTQDTVQRGLRLVVSPRGMRSWYVYIFSPALDRPLKRVIGYAKEGGMPVEVARQRVGEIAAEERKLADAAGIPAGAGGKDTSVDSLAKERALAAERTAYADKLAMAQGEARALALHAAKQGQPKLMQFIDHLVLCAAEAEAKLEAVARVLSSKP